MNRKYTLAAMIACAGGLVLATGTRPEATPIVKSGTVWVPHRNLAIHGPTVVDPAGLSLLTKSSGNSGTAEVLPPTACATPPCISSDPASDGTGLQTPPPKTAWAADGRVQAGAMDTGIAVGNSYVLVSGRDDIALYDKAGKLLGPKYKSSDGSTTADVALPNPFTVRSFFGNLTAEINSTVSLPLDAMPPGSDVNTFGINDYFDNRVLYDHYRNRFWIVALAQNSTLRTYVERVSPKNATGTEKTCTNPLSSDPNACGDEILYQYPALATARRGYIVAAVSKTEDPRDGFYLYWWDADVKDGTCDTLDNCTDVLKFGWQGGDYPTLGLDEHYLLVSNLVGYKDPGEVGSTQQSAYDWITCAYRPECGGYPYEHLTAVPAGALANGLECPLRVCIPLPQARHFAVQYGDRTHVNDWRSLRPVVAHTPLSLGYSSLFANNYIDADEKAWLVLWALRTDATGPWFDQAMISVTPWARSGWDMVLNASFRDDLVYATWHYCEREPCTNRLVRTVRVNWLYPTNSQYVDEGFGRYNAIDDSPLLGSVNYLWPAIAANKYGTMAVVYNRWKNKGKLDSLSQEIRYSVRMAGGTMRPSRLLKGADTASHAFAGPDTVGIAVDPFDDDAIWMAHIYDNEESKISRRIMVGKVFGDVYSDIEAGPVVVASTEGQRLTVASRLINHGDGAAAAGTIDFYLSRDRVLDPDDTFAGRLQFDALGAGAETALRASVRLDPLSPSGQFYVIARANGDGEYSSKNNISPAVLGSPQLCVGPGGQVTLGPCRE